MSRGTMAIRVDRLFDPLVAALERIGVELWSAPADECWPDPPENLRVLCLWFGSADDVGKFLSALFAELGDDPELVAIWPQVAPAKLMLAEAGVCLLFPQVAGYAELVH